MGCLGCCCGLFKRRHKAKKSKKHGAAKPQFAAPRPVNYTIQGGSVNYYQDGQHPVASKPTTYNSAPMQGHGQGYGCMPDDEYTQKQMRNRKVAAGLSEGEHHHHHFTQNMGWFGQCTDCLVFLFCVAAAAISGMGPQGEKYRKHVEKASGMAADKYTEQQFRRQQQKKGTFVSRRSSFLERESVWVGCLLTVVFGDRHAWHRRPDGGRADAGCAVPGGAVLSGEE